MSSAAPAMLPGAARVAIFNEPIVGTVNPTLPIVAHLVARGCEVRYYLADAGMREPIEQAGATFEHFDDYLGRWHAVLAEETPWLAACGFPERELAEAATSLAFGQLMHLNMAFYSLPAGVCLARRVLRRWEGSAGEGSAWRPDLVIHSCQAVYARLAAAKLGVPVASFMTWPGPGVPMQLACLPTEREREAWDADLCRHTVTAAANAIAEKEFHVDVAGTQLACRHFNRQLNLVFSVPALGDHIPPRQRALLDESTLKWVGYTGNQKLHVNGAYLAPGQAEDLDFSGEPWVAPAGVKVLLVTLGSRTVGVLWEQPFHISASRRYTGREFSHRVWQELADHFGGRPDVRVVLGVGPQADAIEGLELPTNFLPVRRLPQIHALAHADAFITHGGANSVMEGAMAGVPMVVLPFCVDQHSNGQAIQRAGAGSVVPQLMEAPGALAVAAEQALNGPDADRLRAGSLKVGKQLLAAGGAEAAAEACMALFGPAATRTAAAAGA